MNIPPHRSPVHEQLDSTGIQWIDVGQSRAVRCFKPVEKELQSFQDLGLCDASCLQCWGLKGPEAGAWLVAQSWQAAGDIYSSWTSKEGLQIFRLGKNEFLIAAAPNASQESLTSIGASSIVLDNTMLFRRQDAVFVLTGTRATQLLAQTCGIHWSAMGLDQLILTRVAGVSCTILPTERDGNPMFRIWLEPAYAVYLWQQMTTICRDLGGERIGLEVVYPNWLLKGSS